MNPSSPSFPNGLAAETDRTESEARSVHPPRRVQNGNSWDDVIVMFRAGKIGEVEFVDLAHELHVCTSRIAEELAKARIEIGAE